MKAAPLTNEYLGTAYLALGRCAEAVPVLRRAAQPAVRQSIPLAMLGYALAKSGQRAEAERILEELLERQRRGYIAPTSLAVLQAGSAIPSRRSHGFAGRSKRDPFLVYNYVNEPLMAPFRRDPRGQDILRAMGLDGRGR